MFEHIELELPKLQRTTDANGTRVYNTPSGKAYPSVTTVTGLLKKQALIEWRKRVGEEEANKISTKASGRGTRVHAYCEKYLLNEEVTPTLFDIEMWSKMRPILHDINHIYALEQSLFSDYLQVAGTVDCIATYKGRRSIIDFKTARRIKHKDDIHDYFMQCAAYAVAFEEMTGIPITQLVVMIAVDDEDTQIFIEHRDNWVAGFLDLRQKYREWKHI